MGQSRQPKMSFSCKMISKVTFLLTLCHLLHYTSMPPWAIGLDHLKCVKRSQKALHPDVFFCLFYENAPFNQVKIAVVTTNVTDSNGGYRGLDSDHRRLQIIRAKEVL